MLAWQALSVSILYEVISLVLIFSNFQSLGWTLHTLNIVRLFIQFHDTAHFSYFSSPTSNKLLGRMIGIYVHFPFDAWRDGHNHHHKHFGNLSRLDLSQTILFTKKNYEEMSTGKKIITRIFREPIVFFLITSPFLWFVGLFYLVIKKYGFLSKAFADKALSIILYLVIFPLIGVSSMKALISVYFAQVIGTLLFHLQHSVNVAYR